MFETKKKRENLKRSELTFKKRGNRNKGWVPILIWRRSNGNNAAKSNKNFLERI